MILRRLAILILTVATVSHGSTGDDSQARTWVVGNGWIEARFQLTAEGFFRFTELRDLRSGDIWSAAAAKASAPFRLRVDGQWSDAATAFRLVGQARQSLPGGGVHQQIVLEDVGGPSVLMVDLEAPAAQPVLRYGARYRNLLGRAVRVQSADMVPWTFADEGNRYASFRVNQWVTDHKSDDFETEQNELDREGTPIEVFSGAHGTHCGWLALRDANARGVFTGWEFDGRARTSVAQSGAGGYVTFASSIEDLNHAVLPGAEFEVPEAFIGLFHGDWDEAGYRTQRFAEAVLAKAPPEPDKFPYVGWDSWGYRSNVDEALLRRNAELAARLGVELFVVDLGWARQLGEWYEDSNKFPHGLRALSDYVHSLGMKFGLHFAFGEAAPSSPVMLENPDWTSSEASDYFGAVPLCLSHQPAREWIIAQALRLIDDYSPDWILQDGENMVKQCIKTTHTHDPADSNYANAVDGLNHILDEIQRMRPAVYWENCENGGNMMTFSMVKRYVTSITNDASGSFPARLAAYGATYPFPPRYADRYMPEQELTPYVTRSYMFGGPWVMMNRPAEMNPDQFEFLRSEIERFKASRHIVENGKVFHLTQRPAQRRIDALQSFDPETNEAFAVVTREQSPDDTFLLRPRGLRPASTYRVSFAGTSEVLLFTGAQLMHRGVAVDLPSPRSSDLVRIDPQN